MASRGATNRGAEDMLDAQNREYHERLSSKTSFLKSLAFDMEMEAKDHNKLLNGVDDDFDSTSRSVETIKYNFCEDAPELTEGLDDVFRVEMSLP